MTLAVPMACSVPPWPTTRISVSHVGGADGEAVGVLVAGKVGWLLLCGLVRVGCGPPASWVTLITASATAAATPATSQRGSLPGRARGPPTRARRGRGGSQPGGCGDARPDPFAGLVGGPVDLAELGELRHESLGGRAGPAADRRLRFRPGNGREPGRSGRSAGRRCRYPCRSPSVPSEVGDRDAQLVVEGGTQRGQRSRADLAYGRRAAISQGAHFRGAPALQDAEPEHRLLVGSEPVERTQQGGAPVALLGQAVGAWPWGRPKSGTLPTGTTRRGPARQRSRARLVAIRSR